MNFHNIFVNQKSKGAEKIDFYKKKINLDEASGAMGRPRSSVGAAPLFPLTLNHSMG